MSCAFSSHAVQSASVKKSKRTPYPPEEDDLEMRRNADVCNVQCGWIPPSWCARAKFPSPSFFLVLEFGPSHLFACGMECPARMEAGHVRPVLGARAHRWAVVF